MFNNFTVERSPVLLFFSWHLKQTYQKALSLHLTAIVWANYFSAPFCSRITLKITVCGLLPFPSLFLSLSSMSSPSLSSHRPKPSSMAGQSSLLFRWTSSAQRAADWIYKHKEICSLIQSGYPWQGTYGWKLETLSWFSLWWWISWWWMDLFSEERYTQRFWTNCIKENFPTQTGGHCLLLRDSPCPRQNMLNFKWVIGFYGESILRVSFRLWCDVFSIVVCFQ